MNDLEEYCKRRGIPVSPPVEAVRDTFAAWLSLQGRLREGETTRRGTRVRHTYPLTNQCAYQLLDLSVAEAHTAGASRTWALVLRRSLPIKKGGRTVLLTTEVSLENDSDEKLERPVLVAWFSDGPSVVTHDVPAADKTIDRFLAKGRRREDSISGPARPFVIGIPLFTTTMVSDLFDALGLSPREQRALSSLAQSFVALQKAPWTLCRTLTCRRWFIRRRHVADCERCRAALKPWTRSRQPRPDIAGDDLARQVDKEIPLPEFTDPVCQWEARRDRAPKVRKRLPELRDARYEAATQAAIKHAGKRLFTSDTLPCG
jgi:hypothetical protein